MYLCCESLYPFPILVWYSCWCVLIACLPRRSCSYSAYPRVFWHPRRSLTYDVPWSLCASLARVPLQFACVSFRLVGALRSACLSRFVLCHVALLAAFTAFALSFALALVRCVGQLYFFGLRFIRFVDVHCTLFSGPTGGTAVPWQSVLKPARTGFPCVSANLLLSLVLHPFIGLLSRAVNWCGHVT